MFTGFTEKTSEFLWDLKFNNERPWFLAHKDIFEQHVNVPFKALAADTAALMEARHPELGLKLRVSRIYRDARRLFGRGPYKDHLWFSLKIGEGSFDGPVFWFELSPADYSYGIGFYSASPAQMQQFRNAVDANPARFERIVKPVTLSGRYKISGEEYARPKGDHGEIINRWYNRKRIGVERSFDFGGDALTDKLPAILVDCYEELLPIYRFMLEFYRLPGEKEAQRR